MRILVTGVCGFVGSTLVRAFREAGAAHTFVGIDSLTRPGSETNRVTLRRLGVRVLHADIRLSSDFETLPSIDAVIDAAAQPSVLAGVDGRTSSRQLVEHNLLGTVNLLEYCRARSAALVLLSTSRVYSIPPLAALSVLVRDRAFVPGAGLPPGLTAEGLDETFSTAPPLSLYGATKLASEHLALEYGAAFGFPVFVNRCGVLAGAGQFGRTDQGIFAFWVNSWLRRRPLSYIGFDGEGHQVRDCLHPADLVPLIEKQLAAADRTAPRVVNVSGGRASARSLRQLSDWCTDRIGPGHVGADPRPRPYDIPWLVLDSGRAHAAWGFLPHRSTDDVLDEILEHARRNPDWMEISDAGGAG